MPQGSDDLASLSVRPDFVPIAGYLSSEILALEKQKLWPSTWLMAARVEQFQKPGDFVTFNIADESIVIVLNKARQLRAFYNVCQHRGRRLVAAESGNIGAQFVCGFHAWRYDLDGKSTYIRNPEDWNGCDGFSAANLSLKDVRVDTWAGWIWICMDPHVEELQEYLTPIPSLYVNFEFEKTRIAWFKTLTMPCNWKTVVDAFTEAYHTAGTHPQMLKFGAGAKMPAVAVGRHSTLRVTHNDTTAKDGMLNQANRDLRKYLHDIGKELNGSIHGLYSDEFVRAAARLEGELDKEAAPEQIFSAFRKLHREEVERSGAHWPEKLTDEEVARAGGTWHIFPNIVMITSYDGALWFRARPNGDDPDSCLFDIWWLGRYAAGKEPPFRHDVYGSPEEFIGQNSFIEQDFSNLRLVQLGMKSRGFQGSRTNPLQEVAVSHLHEVLFNYVLQDRPGWP
jgi:phenylpropionate dioxygenase-like ring-hydroxylating dioxygenase large terminal subunit